MKTKCVARTSVELQEFILLNESVVIDIGASNVEALLMEMQMVKNSHIDFDLFVVPVVSEKKQQNRHHQHHTDACRDGPFLQPRSLQYSTKFKLMMPEIWLTDSLNCSLSTMNTNCSC